MKFSVEFERGAFDTWIAEAPGISCTGPSFWAVWDTVAQYLHEEGPVEQLVRDCGPKAGGDE